MLLLKLVFLALLIRRGMTVCRLQGSPQPPELTQAGDFILGGIFTFRTGYIGSMNTFQTLPNPPTCLQPDQCTELSQYGHDKETKGFSSNASYTNAAIHGKTKLRLTSKRSPKMNVALKGIFTQDRTIKDCTLFPRVTLKCIEWLSSVHNTDKD
ncbi:hypothetical protein D5F01_LYC06129 [Larimichthys crocea]|uniref:Uncharacterized protein n=1 Tax=Larimichthys crocea TaxID=215358 RepID=A0A6G0IV91_LARCR|nr:hypothetical protein D5F01_LYC06129 [Larimichthys crocea]